MTTTISIRLTNGSSSPGFNPPKVHVLGKLYDQLPDDVKVEFDPDDLARLDPWAVAGRYPGDVPEVSRVLAGELIALAAVVYAQCEVVVAERRGATASSTTDDTDA